MSLFQWAKKNLSNVCNVCYLSYEKNSILNKNTGGFANLPPSRPLYENCEDIFFLHGLITELKAVRASRLIKIESLESFKFFLPSSRRFLIVLILIPDFADYPEWQQAGQNGSLCCSGNRLKLKCKQNTTDTTVTSFSVKIWISEIIKSKSLGVGVPRKNEVGVITVTFRVRECKSGQRQWQLAFLHVDDPASSPRLHRRVS